MKFIAELIEIKQVKNVVNDQIITIKLRTTDKQVMALAAIPGEEVVEVTIEQEKK